MVCDTCDLFNEFNVSVTSYILYEGVYIYFKKLVRDYNSIFIFWSMDPRYLSFFFLFLSTLFCQFTSISAFQDCNTQKRICS